MIYSKKDIIHIIIGIIIGAILLVLLSAFQKFILLGQVIFSLKGYIIPIFFGGITGAIISLFFIRLLALNNEIKKENQVLNERNEEIESLYNELEAHSQTIDTLNHSLNNTLNKYVLLIDSVMNINNFRNLSEKEFILKIYTIAKKIIGKYDSAIVYTCQNDFLKYHVAYGYDQNALENFQLTCDFVEKQYPRTDIYYPNQSSIMNLMSEEKRLSFKKINQNSKELIFLNICSKKNKVGGIFFELNVNSQKSYSKNDLAIMKALQSIFENYYEGIELNKIREKQLINIVEAMITMLEFHDPYTKGHSLSVAKISKSMGEAMNLSEEDLNELYLTGLLHDIAKTFIDSDLLNKKGPLTYKEFEKIKEHPGKGADLLANIETLKVIEESVRYHHERCDGKGYPDGLKKNEIPRNARIICVADAYDAMVTDRPYRKALSKTKAIKEIQNNIDTQFCKQAADILLELVEKGILD
ncbi:MAG TPA: HD-GYP domain-containing protein [Clostridia bacterium]|nr:HD-GYP domain-containing protein [Clostridia bacterium]